MQLAVYIGVAFTLKIYSGPALAVFFLFISLTNLENSVKCVLVPHLLQNYYIYLLYIKICYSQ